MKKVFVFIIFFLVGILVVIGYTLLKKNPGKPINNILQTVAKPAFSIDNAPSVAIKGTITQMNGEIMWQSRTATESSQISSLVILQQGEEIQTGENGSLTVEFPKEVSIRIEPKTQIDFVQTLPVNFVASIASGSAEFKKLSNIPVTIRAMHLLVKLNTGDLSVGVDSDNSLVNLNIINGSITAAYNDKNLRSHVVNFDAGQRVSFNDSTRKFE